MSRRRRNVIEMGHDSFLDIVANLVGILIILVVILGAQTHKLQEALTEEMLSRDDAVPAPLDLPGPPPTSWATQTQMDELAQTTMQATAAQRDSMRLEATVARYDQEIALAKKQRGTLLDLIAIAKDAWQEAQQSLDQDRVRTAKLQSEIDRATSRLAELAGTKSELASLEKPIVAVEHLPTPMAKTVFGEEIHLRLKKNQLSVVPIERLIEEIKADLSRTASGFRSGRSASAVGPIRGFVAHYVMDRSVGRITQDGRTGMGVRVSLVGMSVEPADDQIGQPVEQALQGTSFLDVELAGRDPAKTTITVWVYPDSFASFRRLKEHLYRRGFATAARPLESDQQITGGPGGTKSQSQ